MLIYYTNEEEIPAYIHYFKEPEIIPTTPVIECRTDIISDMDESLLDEFKNLRKVIVFTSHDVDDYTSEDGKTITVPRGVTAIAKGTFAYREVENIILPDTIVYMGGDEFIETPNLKTIVIPEGVTDLRGSFTDSGVRRVILPSTMKNIHESTFENCYNLKRIVIPKGVEYIGRNCFKNSGISNIKLPKSVKLVGLCAFFRYDKIIKVNCYPEVKRFIPLCHFDPTIPLFDMNH